MMALGEELGCDRGQVVTFRTEVVVDDIEEDGEAAGMAGLDEPLQILRRAIPRSGRVEEDTVISPISSTWKFGDRHQLDGSRAELLDVIEMPDNPGEVTGFGKGADMQLVEDDFFPASAPPGVVVPDMLRGVDDLARTVHAGGLATRRRIGNGLFPDDITVGTPGLAAAVVSENQPSSSRTIGMARAATSSIRSETALALGAQRRNRTPSAVGSAPKGSS